MTVESEITLESLETSAQSIIQQAHALPATTALSYSQEGIWSTIADHLSAVRRFLTRDHKGADMNVLSESAYKKFAKDSYADYYQLKTMVPEGLSAFFVDYVGMLERVGDHALAVQSQVLQPLESYLSTLVNSPDKLQSKQHHQLLEQFEERDRESIDEDLRKMFSQDQSEFRRYDRVIRRQKEWLDIVPRFNQLVENTGRVNEADMRQVLDNIDALLETIKERMDDPDGNVHISDVGAKDLAALTYTAADELSYHSSYRFRLLNFQAVCEYAREQLPKK